MRMITHVVAGVGAAAGDHTPLPTRVRELDVTYADAGDGASHLGGIIRTFQ